MLGFLSQQIPVLRKKQSIPVPTAPQTEVIPPNPTVKLWDTATGKEIKTLSGHTNEVYGVSFSPDGKMLASASSDNTVKLWRWDFNYLRKEGCVFIRE